MLRILAIMVSLGLAAGSVQAGKIVKYTLSNGQVIYSDTPPPEAASGEEVTVEPLQTFTPPRTPSFEGSMPSDAADESAGYEAFTVTSPENDTTIRDNGGNVRVSLTLSPGLRSGHSIEIYMDGKAIGSGNSTSLTLTDVDRGTHTVRATVKDGDGREIARSNSVIFHLRRGGV